MGLLEVASTPAAAVEVVEQQLLPCPGFEGFEKRLEVQFEFVTAPTGPSVASARGLRNIPRSELDAMLEAAACTIVSRLSNKHFDSYVLSESSLFVYPTAVVIKTCGTTRLLRAIPQLLASAAALSFKPAHCRYTRGTFIFPEAQPAPHHDFSAEAAELDKHFGHLGQGGRAYVMGDALSGANWHIYTADATPFAASPLMTKSGAKGRDPVLTLEVCMTQLDQAKARQFFADSGAGDAKAVTAATGIKHLLPGSSIDDFSFNPCGYSMNGIEEQMHSTIHVTPEDGFSYASFEARGYSHEKADLAELMARVLAVFKPGRVSVALHCDGSTAEAAEGNSWLGSMTVPTGYWCRTSSQQQMPGGACTVFHTLKAATGGVHELSVQPAALAVRGSGCKVKFDMLSAADSYEYEVDSGKSLMPAEVKRRWPSVAAPEWDACGQDGMNLDEEVTDCVIEALNKKGSKVAPVITSFRPVLLARGEGELDGLCAELISARVTAAAGGGEDAVSGAERAFYVMDLGEVVRLWDLWTSAMPRVHPYYAVKCNPDKALLSLLASLGAGFDVASLPELQAVSEACGGEVPTERIIFANPCKLPSHISAAASHGVHRTTFDSESELHKLRRGDRNAKAVLRIRVDDPSARCPLGVKYGAELGECRRLLYVAKRLGVEVEGVAFHVGSGAGDTSAFSMGVKAARRVFETAAEVGFANMCLLDIGGGFTADGSAAGGVSFKEAAAAIGTALDTHFPLKEFPGLQVIAEPGRFFAETPFTLVAHVFGTRARGRGSKRRYEYWIDDGIYGSMNSLLYDHAVLSVRPLRMVSAAPASATSSPVLSGIPGLAGAGYSGRGKQNRTFSSTVFGPTCDGLDTVLRDVSLPKLECGDWLVFPRMGAYTKAAGSSFNGFSVGDINVAAYVLTSAMARPFYAASLPKSGAGAKGKDLGHADVLVGEVEWGILEGGVSSEDEEDGVAWMVDGNSSGSDSDE